MRRRTLRIGFVAAVLAAVGVLSPGYNRIATSAQSFQQYFRDLDQSGSSLGPIERVVFSLVLANSNVAESQK